MENLKEKKPLIHCLKALGIILGAILAFSAVYMPINSFNHTRSSLYHAYLDIELKIPLIPFMILFYVGAYLLPLYPILLKKRIWDLYLMAKTIILSAIIGGIIFLIFPTQLGWERSLDGLGIFTPIYEYLFKVDLPHNLVPSLHVVMTYLLIVPCLKHIQNKIFKYATVILLFLVCISIIFVHQHHLLDLFTGYLLAKLTYAYYYLPRVELRNTTPSLTMLIY